MFVGIPCRVCVVGFPSQRLLGYCCLALFSGYHDLSIYIFPYSAALRLFFVSCCLQQWFMNDCSLLVRGGFQGFWSTQWYGLMLKFKILQFCPEWNIVGDFLLLYKMWNMVLAFPILDIRSLFCNPVTTLPSQFLDLFEFLILNSGWPTCFWF